MHENVKLVHVQAIKLHGRSGGVFPLIPNLGARYRWVTNLPIRLLYSFSTRGKDDPSGLYGQEKVYYFCRESISYKKHTVLWYYNRRDVWIGVQNMTCYCRPLLPAGQ